MKGYGGGGGGGSPRPKGPGPQAAATGAAPFHLYSGGGSLSFYSFFHFGGFHLRMNYIENVYNHVWKLADLIGDFSFHSSLISKIKTSLF